MKACILLLGFFLKNYYLQTEQLSGIDFYPLCICTLFVNLESEYLSPHFVPASDGAGHKSLVFC